MKCRFGKKLEWKSPKDVRHKGKFAFVRFAYDFYDCREAFLSDWYNHIKRRRIILSIGMANDKDAFAKRRKAVARFIYECEEKLGIKDKYKTLFNETTFERVIRVKVAKYWLKSRMRMSLFTLLLRAGVGSRGKQYNPAKHTIEECMHAQDYLKKTKKALKLFFSGRTHFTGHADGSYGWRDQLRDKDHNENSLKELLVKPPKKTTTTKK